MNNATLFETLWWWLYDNIFIGRVSAILAAIFLFCAIYIFIRWRMFAVSIILLSAAFVVAYAGGFIMIARGIK